MLDSNSKSIGSYQAIFFIQVIVVCPTIYPDTLQIPLFTHNCDNGIKVSQNNQALDTWTLL